MFHVAIVYLFKFFLILFIFGCARFSLLHGLFSNCGKQGPLSSCHGQASHCSDFSRCRAWALGAWASVAVARGLSCSAARGIKPVSPALAGGFVTPEPPGKPNCVCVCVCVCVCKIIFYIRRRPPSLQRIQGDSLIHSFTRYV